MTQVILLFLGLNFFQGSTDVFKNIETTLKAGSAKELVKYFGETVDLKIDGTSSNYSRNQAEMVLRKFFQTNPVRGFSYTHQGTSPEGLKYAIGTYQFDGGSYRVLMLIKKANGVYLVDTFNFTRE